MRYPVGAQLPILIGSIGTVLDTVANQIVLQAFAIALQPRALCGYFVDPQSTKGYIHIKQTDTEFKALNKLIVFDMFLGLLPVDNNKNRRDVKS